MYKLAADFSCKWRFSH